MKKENSVQISQLSLNIGYTDEDVKRACIKKLKINEKDLISYGIRKKSIDARKKEDIHYSLSVVVQLSKKAYDKVFSGRKEPNEVSRYEDKPYIVKRVSVKENMTRPVVVGSGPAGLFCAYLLALSGLRPVIIEQGQSVEERSISVEKFWKTGELSEHSNVQFGEGGAGTFSDGKLNTMVKDPYRRIPFVLETFVKFGADSEIISSNKPHIGTDVLKEVLVNMRKEIISLGGEYRFETKFTDFNTKDGSVKEIILNGKDSMDCDTLVLALGHSARDTFSLLLEKGLLITPKPFAVGLRVEHTQEMISRYQYGSMYDRLPPADYKVTHTSSDGRGVYSFCMCPGGYVVNSSSEKGGTLVNGMSYNDRAGENANSAIVVSVNTNDFGADDALAGVRFQRKLEEKAFALASGRVPIQLFRDFADNNISKALGDVNPCIKGAAAFANLREILPDSVSNAIVEGMLAFGKKIRGFDRADAVFSGVESRTSCPLRIVRDNDSLQAVIKGIYPVGEGAGYAGGITSAAVDGIKAAEKIIESRTLL